MQLQNVLLSIKGRQFTSDWDSEDCFEVLTPGKLTRRDGEVVITYNESELTGLGGVSTRLTVSPARVTMTRSGKFCSEMIFEKGRRYISYRDFGLDCGMAVGVNAHRVETRFDDEGGVIDVEYALDIENQYACSNNMLIEIKTIGELKQP